MKIDITHGTQGILQMAGRYRTPGDDTNLTQPRDITSVGVLLAMLDEEEYRAAIWLSEHLIEKKQIFETFSCNVIEDTLCDNRDNEQNKEHVSPFFSGLRFFLDGDEVTIGSLSPELSAAILGAMQSLHKVLPQVVLSTEHLLYAISLEEHEVGSFLRTQNVTPEHILEKILQQEGIPVSEPETISIPWDEKSDNTTGGNVVKGDITGNLKIGDTYHEQPGETATHANTSNAESQLKQSPQHEMMAVYRILDASANRAIEAMRVLEDYVRFGLDDERLLRQTKQMRHDLAETIRQLPQRERFASRNTVGDVGTEVEGTNEYSRLSMTDVLGANFSRLQESLRSLEEYGKLVAAQPNQLPQRCQPAQNQSMRSVQNTPLQLSRVAEQLRYRSYTLQKNVLLSLENYVFNETTSNEGGIQKASSLDTRLQNAKLYVLLDCRNSENEFVELVQAILSGGADVIQLRDKLADDRTLLQRARQLRELTEGSNALMIVNDRPDLAILSHADGVHVGQEELTVSEVRDVLGTEKSNRQMIIGVSTHSIEQARQAHCDGADYIGVGPVFPSPTKQFDVFPGIDFLEQVAAEISLPAFAIGGINLENISQITATGLQRVAIQSVVTEASDPASTCRQIKSLLGS